MAVDSESMRGDSLKTGWSASRPISDSTPLYSVAPTDGQRIPLRVPAHDMQTNRTERLPFGVAVRRGDGAQAIALADDGVPVQGVQTSSGMEAAFARMSEQISSLLADHVTPLRLASHLAVVAVASIILIVSQINLPAWEVSLRLLPEGAESLSGLSSARSAAWAGAYTSGPSTAPLAGHESLQRSAIPFTIERVEPVKDIRFYTVKPGDTVLGIAEKFGIAPETIVWSNSGLEKHVELIRTGDQLAILPVDGAYHTVVAGDTLSGIANEYNVDMATIVSYALNGLEDLSTPLAAGQKLVIPGGSKPFVEQYAVGYSGPIPSSARIGSGSFVWPASGPITQPYWGAHRGIDIGGWTGAPVTAMDSGFVTLAATGWNTGYGNYVIVDHGNGFSTLYAHLNNVDVRAGASVARGQQVGSVGNTGNSTGPHLHIEILYQGVPRNPLGYLP